jgi:dolichyl-phosphate beta-glucosyltransferase
MIVYCLIPFYNEEKRIEIEKYNELFNDNKSINFFLIDDGSDDNTYETLKILALNKKNVLLKRNKYNIGKAETIRNGFLELSQENYQYIGFLDSDLATPFNEFLRIKEIAIINNLQLVFASRIKLLGNKIQRNRYRHFFSRIVLTIINLIFKLNIYDTQCGCKIFSKEIVDQIFREKFATKWLFDIEIFIRFFKFINTNLIKEVPINEWKEIKGSKIKFIDFMLVPVNIIKLSYVYILK